MAELDNDDLYDDLQRAVRMLLRLAVQLGEALAQAREEALRRAELRDREVAEALRQRYLADRMLAREQLFGVDRMSDEQLEGLELSDLARHYEVAAQWRTEDYRASDVYVKLSEHIKDRFGFDPGEAVEPTQAGLLLAAAEFERRAAAERHERVAATAREAQIDHEARADVFARKAEDLRATARRLGEKLDPEKPIEEYTDLERARYDRVRSAEVAAEGSERDAASHLFRAEFAELGARGHEERAAALREASLTPDQQRGLLAAERANAKAPAGATTPGGRPTPAPATTSDRGRARDAGRASDAERGR